VRGDQTREKIENLMDKSEIAVLVIIDDIDRIDNVELCTLFKTVGNIGNLPNVYYLLAYDKISVSDMVEEVGFTNKSISFIAKIVQYPFLASSLENLELKTSIKDAFEQHFKDIENKDSTVHNIVRLISPIVKTHRAINRLNAEFSLYNDLGVEIDGHDFIIILIIKNYYPKVFALLPSYKTKLVGTDSNKKNSNESLKNTIEELITKAEITEVDKNIIQTLLENLFVDTSSSGEIY
jgi:predicted KAP-like P-loop ATPase